MSSDALVGIVSFGVIFTLEYFFPFFKFPGLRIKHALTNFSLAAINTFIIFLGARALSSSLEIFQQSFGGLAALFGPRPLAKIFFAIILFDLWMYMWHRMNHEIPFLWRFHRVHHTDPQMDSSTALRFHPGEMIFSSLLEVAVLLLLGVNFSFLIIYKALMFPVILLHHSNVDVPLGWDKFLNKLIVMPRMHRVHHSEIMEETNSNYGSIFSFWDLLFRSLRQRPDIRAIKYGIGLFKGVNSQRIRGLLLNPFK